jgi:hypothetical protein
MQLTETSRKFILHWGDMGARWGVNRTVAQIHALLYLAGNPLPAEEIAGTLGVVRSNVSNSIRGLLAWNLVLYNAEGMHSGKYCYGKTPLRTFFGAPTWRTPSSWIGRRSCPNPSPLEAVEGGAVVAVPGP